MSSINKRVFGSDIPENVKQKLEIRQKLAGGLGPNDSLDLSSYSTNAPGSSKYGDLSSRTPMARLWTAVQIQKHVTANPPVKYDIDDEFTEKDNHIYIKENDKIVEKEVTKHERIVYEIGNHNVNIKSKVPNERVEDNPSGVDNINQIFPNVFETNKNQFLKPPAGITSITSNTEGSLGAIKKTTVNFLVHNFHDYDKIYSKYFLKPGALLFADFGWDTSELYDPRNLIFEDLNGGKSLEETLYGKGGAVTLSNGDLETVVGYVTTYDAKIKENGSVECSVEIVSKNSALINHEYDEEDGLRNKVLYQLDFEIINFAAQHFKGGAELLKPDWNASAETQEDWLRVVEKFASTNLAGTIKNIPTDKSLITGVYWQTYINKDDDEVISNSNNIYVSWGFFEDKILCAELGIDKSLDDILFGENLSVRFDSSQSFIRFDSNLFERQKSEKDATSISFIYPENWDETYNTFRNKKPVRESEPNSYTTLDRERGRIPLRELFISVNLIKRAFKESKDINQVISRILDTINKDSFDIFELKMYSAKEHGAEMSIVDKNFIMSENDIDDETEFFENLFMFQPHSPNSIVKGYDLAFSTPTGGLQNMIAIQSMSSGKQLFPLSAIVDQQLSLKMEQLADDNDQIGIVYLPEIGNYTSERIEKKSKDSESVKVNYVSGDKHLGGSGNKKAFLDAVSSTFSEVSDIDDIKSAIEKAEDPDDRVENTKSDVDDDVDENTKAEKYGDAKVAGSISEYYGYLAKKDFYRNGLSSIIPVKLSLSIYGISSMMPGDLFRVDYLPERYRNLVYFQVMSVSHDVNGSSWTTTLDTVMRIRKVKKAKMNLHKDVKDIFLAKKLLDELQLTKIQEYKKYMKKLKVISDRPKNPSTFDYIFSFTATKTVTIEIEPAGTFAFGSILKTFNDPVPKNIAITADGFVGNYNKRLHSLVYKLLVYDYFYSIDLKEGEVYKLLISGDVWMIIPNSFDNSKLLALESVFEAINSY